MKKIDKRIWWSVPIILGIYLIFKQYSKRVSTSAIAPETPSDTSNIKNTYTKSSYSSSYPLKKGSRDSGSPLSPKGLVVELQRLINTRGYVPNSSMILNYQKLAEDGIFGSKTEDAVFFWIGKDSINDATDLKTLSEALVKKIPFSNIESLF